MGRSRRVISSLLRHIRLPAKPETTGIDNTRENVIHFEVHVNKRVPDTFN